MKTRYLLKRKGGKGQTHPIYVALYEGDQTEIIYTGQRINLKEWSKEDRLPKDQKGEVYKQIEKIRSSILLSMRRLEAKELPITPFTVREAYKSLKKEKQSEQLQKDQRGKADLKSINRLCDQWTGNHLFRYKKSTIKAVEESINQFKDYLKITGQSNLERKDINEELISGYERYLLEKKRLADSTHGKRMKHLRWFLKWIGYDVKNIKLRTGKKKIIFLSINELKSLEAKDVSDTPIFQKAKDMYLLGCYTGLRISDLKRISENNTLDGLIRLTLQKSGGKIHVELPIVQEVRTILERYGNRAPKISEGDLNKNIKDVCRLAGVNTPVEMEIYKGGQKITKTFPKYDLISSHTSGKTFISTVARERYQLTPAETAAIVGKSLKTLLSHYFNLPADEARRKIIELDKAQMNVA